MMMSGGENDGNGLKTRPGETFSGSSSWSGDSRGTVSVPWLDDLLGCFFLALDLLSSEAEDEAVGSDASSSAAELVPRDIALSVEVEKPLG